MRAPQRTLNPHAPQRCFSPLSADDAAPSTVNVCTSPNVAVQTIRKTLHLGFLVHAPAAAKVKALDPNRSPPDEFLVKGWFDSKLETVSTIRNWNTVHELAKRLK